MLEKMLYYAEAAMLYLAAAIKTGLMAKNLLKLYKEGNARKTTGYRVNLIVIVYEIFGQVFSRNLCSSDSFLF